MHNLLHRDWATLIALVFLWIGLVFLAAAQESKTADGLTVFVGVVPARIVKGPPPHSGEPPMHGGTPRHGHEYHGVAAIFDAASNARISDATLIAQVSGLGLAGSSKSLEPMKIADTTTYGGFFDPSSQWPLVIDFKYDHRRL